MKAIHIILIFITLLGCLSQTSISNREVRRSLNKSLPKKWKIESIKKQAYPWSFEKDGPAGYHVVIKGFKRKSLIVWEESKNDWRSGYQYISPSYNIWVMPKRFHGDPIECTRQTSYLCDSESAYYIGSNDNVSVFINCQRCYFIKTNFVFRKKQLVKNLRETFELNRNIYE